MDVMVSGLNKYLRTIESKVKGKGHFDSRLIKATFNGDHKEPKEKHLLCKFISNLNILVILDCMKGKHLD
jgi:hypothetical protein